MALISKKRAEATYKASKDYEESRGGLPTIKPSVGQFFLQNVSATTTSLKSKNPGRAMIVLEWQDKKKEYKPITERFFVEGEDNYVDISLQKMVTRGEHLGLPALVEAEDAAAIVKWWAKGLNKFLKLAIGAEARIWEKEKDGVPDWQITYDPIVAYSGTKEADLDSTFDVGKWTKALNAENQAKYDKTMGHDAPEPDNDLPFDPPAKAEPVKATVVEEDDDLAIMDEEPKKVTAAKAAAKAKQEEPVSDDLDFSNDALNELEL